MLYKFFHFASQTAALQAQQKAKSFMAMESLSKWSRKQAAHRHVEERRFLCCYADVVLINDVKRENKNQFAEISRETSPK